MYKVLKKSSFCIMWLLYVGLQLLRRKNRCGLVWAVMINPPELPIEDEARNEAHIASTGVRLYLHKKRNRKLAMHHEIS